MRSDTPAWLGAEPEEDAARSERRQRTLLAAAVVPWLIVLALVLGDRSPTAQVTGSSDHAGAGPSQEADRPAPPPDPTSADEPSPHSDPPRGPATAHERAEADVPTLVPGSTFDPPTPSVTSQGPDHRATAALAIVIARAWLTDVSPRLPIPGIEPAGGARYAEHLVVEAIDAPSADAAVATVLAVLLEDGEPLSTRVRRLAVPLALDGDGARPGGQPWWLPAPDLSVRELRTTPVDDPDALAAAADALTRAGYLDVAVESLSASPGWPTRANVRAMTPDGEPVAGPVWLRRHAGGYVVAGTPANGQLDPASEPIPTSPEPDPGAFTPDPDPDAQEPER